MAVVSTVKIKDRNVTDGNANDSGRTERTKLSIHTKLILKSLGVVEVEAKAIAFKALEPFPEESL